MHWPSFRQSFEILHALGFMCECVLTSACRRSLRIENLSQSFVRLSKMKSFHLAFAWVEEIVWWLVKVVRILLWTLADGRCIMSRLICHPSNHGAFLRLLYMERFIWTLPLTLRQWNALALDLLGVHWDLVLHGQWLLLDFWFNVRQVVHYSWKLLPLFILQELLLLSIFSLSMIAISTSSAHCWAHTGWEVWTINGSTCNHGPATVHLMGVVEWAIGPLLRPFGRLRCVGTGHWHEDIHIIEDADDKD